ncbi:Enterocin A Immunity [Lachnospiraceae bacterium KHCPX20]|nr:Enterocin A Immunity [Lachnospiraceae bacterium KHCPX20]
MNKFKKDTLLPILYDLALDETTQEDERKIIIDAKNRLETGEDFLTTVSKLKGGLMIVSADHILTENVLKLYSELLRQYPKRDIFGLPGGFIV